jgi:hypothetical protein
VRHLGERPETRHHGSRLRSVLSLGRGASARTGRCRLGLALAKWIAAAHGGSVACTSELGQSTELVVELPAAHAVAVVASGRLNARLTNPPNAPIASAAHVTAGVQMESRPSAASSE